MPIEQQNEPIHATLDTFRKFFQLIKNRNFDFKPNLISRPVTNERHRAAVKSMLTGIENRPQAVGLVPEETTSQNEIVLVCHKHLLPSLEEVKAIADKLDVDVNFVTLEQIYSPVGVCVWRVNLPGDLQQVDLPFAEYGNYSLADLMIVLKTVPELQKFMSQKMVFAVGPKPSLVTSPKLESIQPDKMKKSGFYWHEIGQNSFLELK